MGLLQKPPLRREYFEKMVNMWSRVVHYGESGCVYYYAKADLLRRIEQLFADTDLFQRHFGDLCVSVVDCDVVGLDDTQEVLNLAQSYKSDVLLVTATESFLFDQNSAVLSGFETLVRKRLFRSVLLFFDTDFTHPTYQDLFSRKHSLLQNIMIHPLHDTENVHQFLAYLELKWSMSFERKAIDQIVAECGGHFWLVKQAARLIRDNGTLPDALHKDRMIGLRLSLMWDRFLESEQLVLKEVAFETNNLLRNDLDHSLSFLIQSGLVAVHDQRFCITVPALAAYIRHVSRQTLSLGEAGELMCSGVLVNSHFSSQERSVLKLLLTYKTKIVDRDKVAEAIWGEQWQESYSDWAIDQLMSRIRKKLADFDIADSYVETKRGKGFVIYE